MNQTQMSASARPAILAVGGVLVSLLCSTAYAQWLPDRAYTEGPGIRVGDLELHPGIAVRGGYDTNVFRAEKNTVGSAILAVTPHLNISTLSRQRLVEGEDAAGAAAPSLPPPIAFNAGLSGTLFHYFDDRAPTNVGLDTNIVLSVLPERSAGFDVGIDFERDTRPFTAYAGDGNNRYAHDAIRPHFRLRSQSQSGVLKGSLTYRPLINLYESDPFTYLNYFQHELRGEAAWKFLPYTALLYDGAVSFVRYQDPTQPEAIVRLTDSDRFETRLGIGGAITRLLSIRALAGYAVVANALHEFDDKEDVIGEASLRYGDVSSSVEGGYQRALQVSSLGSWMLQNRGYLRSSVLLARVLAITVEAGAAKVNYGRLLSTAGGPLGVDKDTNTGTTKREDVRVDAGVHAEYRVASWFAILADFTALATITDFRFTTNTPIPYPAQFKTYQAYGGVRFHY